MDAEQAAQHNEDLGGALRSAILAMTFCAESWPIYRTWLQARASGIDLGDMGPEFMQYDIGLINRMLTSVEYVATKINEPNLAKAVDTMRKAGLIR